MLRLHLKIIESLLNLSRDIALIAEPGMGLTTILDDLENVENKKCLRLETEAIVKKWNDNYQELTQDREKVFDSLLISTLIQKEFIKISIPKENKSNSNLALFLKDYCEYLDSYNHIYVIIDKFDELPDELAKILLIRLKEIRDTLDASMFYFVIGGAIDFYKYFPTNLQRNSPATNFIKIYPSKFLLSQEECRLIIEDCFRPILKYPDITQMVIDWSGGYLHYLLEFCKWIEDDLNEIADSPQALANRLYSLITDKNKIPLLKYCYQAWEQIKNDSYIIHRLSLSISIGMVYDYSFRCDKALYLGLLFQTDPYTRQVYYPCNKIVAIFLRQRLSELNYLLPAEDSSLYIPVEMNNQAFSVIKLIESQIRFYISDQLFHITGEKIEKLVKEFNNGIYEEIVARIERDTRSGYSAGIYNDIFHTFLNTFEFSLIAKDFLFSNEQYDKWDDLVHEIGFLKNRLFFNQPITTKQIDALETNWNNFQRIIAQDITIKKVITGINKKTYNLGANKMITVLFLSADPTNASRLRISEEFREISEQLRLAELREQFFLELPVLSLRPKDISGALLNTKPRIVHFSGHGTKDGALCFENEQGQALFVEPKSLSELFEQFKDQVDCVLLNACYSELQAKVIADQIKYVIGMNDSIGDKAAIAFSTGFYQALGAGRSIKEAYKLGCIQIGLNGINEGQKPILITKVD